jgi:hypothetical protein
MCSAVLIPSSTMRQNLCGRWYRKGKKCCSLLAKSNESVPTTSSKMSTLNSCTKCWQTAGWASLVEHTDAFVLGGKAKFTGMVTYNPRNVYFRLPEQSWASCTLLSARRYQQALETRRSQWRNHAVYRYQPNSLFAAA